MPRKIWNLQLMLCCLFIWSFKVRLHAFLIRKSLLQKVAMIGTDSTALCQRLDSNKNCYYDDEKQVNQNRRDVLKFAISSSAFLFCSSSSAADIATNTKIRQPGETQQMFININTTTLEPLDFEKIIKENTINVTVINGTSKTYINRTTFEKVQETILTKDQRWLFQPLFKITNKSTKMQTISSISDAKILFASAVAGVMTEVARSGLIYPVQTIKTRVQTSPPSTSSSSSFQEYTMMIWKNIRLQSKIGDLYAGYWPSLIASLPAVGAYFGVRDVMKRDLTKISISKDNLLPFLPSIHMDDLSITLLSVLIADIISLIIRTPALAFATRRQAENTIDVERIMETEEELLEENPSMKEDDLEMIENELIENDNMKLFPRRMVRSDEWSELWDNTLKQIPVVIITDLPYLLLKISALRLLANGTENIGEFTLLNIYVSFFVAALTTPFDVARTRILVDSDVNAANGLDGGSGEDILTAMVKVSQEGGSNKEIRFQNLYKGWFERSVYFGMGLAWLDPFRILCYLAIRDFILLEVLN